MIPLYKDIQIDPLIQKEVGDCLTPLINNSDLRKVNDNIKLYIETKIANKLFVVKNNILVAKNESKAYSYIASLREFLKNHFFCLTNEKINDMICASIVGYYGRKKRKEISKAKTKLNKLLVLLSKQKQSLSYTDDYNKRCIEIDQTIKEIDLLNNEIVSKEEEYYKMNT